VRDRGWCGEWMEGRRGIVVVVGNGWRVGEGPWLVWGMAGG